jgi:hypothetical protein
MNQRSSDKNWRTPGRIQYIHKIHFFPYYQIIKTTELVTPSTHHPINPCNVLL